MYTEVEKNNHQCSKGFWLRLFLLFCLDFRTEAY